MALFTAILFGGLLLQWGDAHGSVLTLFAVLFSCAMLARLISASFLARQSEPSGLISVMPHACTTSTPYLSWKVFVIARGQAEPPITTRLR